MVASLLLAVAVQGQLTVPPASSFMAEKEIDDFVVAVRTEHIGVNEHDPLWIIRTVNKLQPMGPEKALSLMREIQNRRVDVGDRVGEDMYWAVNLLFEEPAHGRVSLPLLGGASPEDDKNPATRRWPIFLHGDVPLARPLGWDLAGVPEQAADYGVRLAKTLKWRTTLLRPLNNPFEAYDAAQKSGQIPNSDELISEMASQLGRLVRNAYRPYNLPRNRMSGIQTLTLYRNQYRGKWDPAKQNYVK